MNDIKLKILTEKDFLFLAKKNPKGIYDEETQDNLDRIIKRLIRGKEFCTGDEKQLLNKFFLWFSMTVNSYNINTKRIY